MALRLAHKISPLHISHLAQKGLRKKRSTDADAPQTRIRSRSSFNFGLASEGENEFGSQEQCCLMAKFDPFLSLDCARVEGGGVA